MTHRDRRRPPLHRGVVMNDWFGRVLTEDFQRHAATLAAVRNTLLILAQSRREAVEPPPWGHDRDIRRNARAGHVETTQAEGSPLVESDARSAGR